MSPFRPRTRLAATILVPSFLGISILVSARGLIILWRFQQRSQKRIATQVTKIFEKTPSDGKL
jgi:hypothetical protein